MKLRKEESDDGEKVEGGGGGEKQRVRFEDKVPSKIIMTIIVAIIVTITMIVKTMVKVGFDSQNHGDCWIVVLPILFFFFSPI